MRGATGEGGNEGQEQKERRRKREEEEEELQDQQEEDLVEHGNGADELPLLLTADLLATRQAED